ncbi:hypothetical protein TWF718_009810 [Orbilia javanica]|uniref:VASt domain-containing protein n=1 Tax=Orbilia javanica TaxID=47235 RepID=A0AAN8MN16_9PEZI
MRGYQSAGVLLSLAATALADPFLSSVDVDSNVFPLEARGDAGTFGAAMANLHKRETIMSLMRRSFSEMEGNIPVVFARQVDSIPTNPKTGDTGKSNFDADLWEQQVEAACAESISLLADIVTKVTDPAGVAVCYNLPFYNSTTGAFTSDIRLYKIANGTKDWEAAGTKVSLSVQYEGATVRLGNSSAAAAGANKIATPKELVRAKAKLKATGDESVQQAAKALEKPKAKTSAPATSAPATSAPATSAKGSPAKASSAKASSAKATSAKATSTKDTPAKAAKAAKTSAPATSAKSSAPATSAKSPAKAGQTPSTATLKKRMNMNMNMASSDDDDVKGFEPKLLQTMRFTGQVNPNIMRNKTMTKDPNIMKLVLTPSLMLIGVTPEGSMNASVAAAQVQYATGAFSTIFTPTPAAAPFVLPGVYISIFPLGLYLCTVYTILFVLIVGWGTVERYLFRMSFRKRSAMMNGQDGFGKI